MNDYCKLPHDFQEVIQKEYARIEAQDSDSKNDNNKSSYRMTLNKVASKRRKYSDEEREQIIRIFDSIENKTKVIKFLQDVCGYEEIYLRKIQRWKSTDKKTMGRPVSREFESEVLDVYKRHFPNTLLSRHLLRDCGYLVLNREYFNVDTGAMEKKWLADNRTCKLQFTERWIKGMLKRNKCSTAERVQQEQ